VSAFSPLNALKKSSRLQMSFSDKLGAQPPLGYWDPFDFLRGADEAKFNRLRTVSSFVTEAYVITFVPG
jgi:hypothetical protein